MKVSDYIAQFIKDQGIKEVFGYTGGAITHLADSVQKIKGERFIQVYHEQTASIAVEGYSRIARRVGVAAATSGPGATNMITGIADAYFDSVAAVYLTGQVNTFEYKYKKPVRQQGFQETDIVSVIKPVTKYAKMIKDPKEIRYELEKAFYLAQEGRPGPVLLDLPMDVQRAEIDPITLKGFSPKAKPELQNTSFDIIRLIKKAKRPVILAGGGVINANARKSLAKFVSQTKFPVVVSLMGKGAFDETKANFVGMIGSSGNRSANFVLSKADLVLAIGSRLDTRQTGTSLKQFVEFGKIIHVDIDAFEVKHNRIKNRIPVCQDADSFLQALIKNNLKPNINTWLKEVTQIKQDYSQAQDIKNNSNKIPYQVMEVLNDLTSEDAIYCVDIGQNQMFAAQALKIKKDQCFITSGGMAPMGYALPAAIGASFASNLNRQVYAICGDGGLVFALQALMLLSQYKLPIKVILLNNYSLGMIVQFQDLYFDSLYTATTKEGGYLVPDFSLLAAAYSLKYHLIKPRDLETKFKKALKEPGPALIEIDIKQKTIVMPRLTVGFPLSQMHPLPENKSKKQK